MAKSRILIVGDSFCAPTSHAHTWYGLLARSYDLKNFGQNGVGQYKIHQQLIDHYRQQDHVIYLITSPFRMHTERNPFYACTHATHSCADLIYEDIKAKPDSKDRTHAMWVFEKIFDLEYAKFVHRLIVDHDCQKFPQLVPISFFDCQHIDRSNVLDLYHIWQSHPGSINHMDRSGHTAVYELIQKQLNSLTR